MIPFWGFVKDLNLHPKITRHARDRRQAYAVAVMRHSEEFSDWVDRFFAQTERHDV